MIAFQRSWRNLICVALAAGCVMGCGGSTPNVPPGYSKEEYTAIRNTMDRVASRLEQFGTISVSSPMLAPTDTVGFEFTLDKTANGFYTDARTDVNARAAAAFSSSQQSGAGFSVQADLSAAMNNEIQQSLYQRQVSQYLDQRRSVEAAATAARQQRLAQLPTNASEADRLQATREADELKAKMLADAGYSTAPTPPTISSASPGLPTGLVPSTDPSAAKLAALPAIMKLLGDNAPVVLDNDDAIIKAARDNALKGIFSLLGEPKRLQFKDKKVLLGVAMVAVDPGWQTQHHYAADVSVLCSYDYVPARAERVKAYVNAVITSGNTQAVENLRKIDQIKDHVEAINAKYKDAKRVTLAFDKLAPFVALINSSDQKKCIPN